MSSYTAAIGLEVHVELKTKSKMFCGCRNDPHHSEPNQNVCPICLAHPGTLPVPNGEAIAMLLRFGLAVGATRADYSEFDRKHYFYPDLPKAYQISQYSRPFLEGGTLAGVALTRVHLEEDTARSQHEKGEYSLVDFNRAGIPLMELVTEPVIHDAKTATTFARELQLVLRTLNISDAQMEQGEMRVEANVSLSASDTLGTKVEVKNLNSFRSVAGAITYEIERQSALLAGGGRVAPETRGWDEVRRRTFFQRSKETANDYRYFPDPDIPKIRFSVTTQFSESRLKENMPELPGKKRVKYHNIGITRQQVETILTHSELDGFFSALHEELSSHPEAKALLKLGANYLTSDIAAILEARGTGAKIALQPRNFAALIKITHAGAITSRVAKDLLSELLFVDGEPEKITFERGLLVNKDTAALVKIAQDVIADNPDAVRDFRAGKEASLQYLVGQGMKMSRGSAEPGQLAKLLREHLSS
jgi:aspartyl-tRNA(Asn)/glutamyl-tRNA(Gln) amidotransferase subunit B